MIKINKFRIYFTLKKQKAQNTHKTSFPVFETYASWKIRIFYFG